MFVCFPCRVQYILRWRPFLHGALQDRPQGDWSVGVRRWLVDLQATREHRGAAAATPAVGTSLWVSRLFFIGNTVSERFAWGLIYSRCVVKNSVVYMEINRCVAKRNSVCMEIGQVVLKTDQTCLKNSLLVNVSWQRTRLVLKNRPNLPWKQT